MIIIKSFAAQRMQAALSGLQQQLGEAVQEEVIKAEERIRAFSKKTYDDLEEFRNRANRDHKALVRQVLFTLLNNFSSAKHFFIDLILFPERCTRSNIPRSKTQGPLRQRSCRTSRCHQKLRFLLSTGESSCAARRR